MNSIIATKCRSLMKAITSALFISASALPLLALKPGDVVSLNALTKAEFVKGDAPKDWKANEVYIFECWATWCGPCVAAIPHVDALFDKYQEKGLHVIGMNVFEDGKDLVAKFVKKKGAGMSYPVAYTGRGGAFEEEWLKPAGVKSIPHAFVVKNGRLLFMIHPASLSEQMIEALLSGGDAEAALLKKITRAKNSSEEVKALVAKFSAESSARNFAAAEATLAKIKDLDENYTGLAMLELGLAASQGKWDEMLARLKNEKGGMAVTMLGMQFEMDQSVAPPSAVTEAMAGMMENLEDSDALGYAVKATLLAKLGRKNEAHAAAEKTAKAFAAMSKGAIPQESLDKYVNSYKTDKPSKLMELFGMFRAAVPGAGK